MYGVVHLLYDVALSDSVSKWIPVWSITSALPMAFLPWLSCIQTDNLLMVWWSHTLISDPFINHRIDAKQTNRRTNGQTDRQIQIIVWFVLRFPCNVASLLVYYKAGYMLLLCCHVPIGISHNLCKTYFFVRWHFYFDLSWLAAMQQIINVTAKARQSITLYVHCRR